MCQSKPGEFVTTPSGASKTFSIDGLDHDRLTATVRNEIVQGRGDVQHRRLRGHDDDAVQRGFHLLDANEIAEYPIAEFKGRKRPPAIFGRRIGIARKSRE